MESLFDPFQDRAVKSVKAPPHRPLPPHLMYPDPSRPTVPDLQFQFAIREKDKIAQQISTKIFILNSCYSLIRQHLLAEGTIAKQELVKIIKDMTALLKSEPNVLKLQEPVIIVGDIHGQYYDLIHMFEKVVDQRQLPKTRMLFLGDYVDRGIFSIEVLIFLFSLKVYFIFCQSCYSRYYSNS